MLNIAFSIRVVKYCCTVKDANARYILNSLFNKHIANYLDWQRAYDWYELKSILLFFMIFSGVQNERELLQVFEHKNLPMIFKKYVPIKIELKTK